MNFMPRGRTVTAAYIIVALTSFLRVLKEKRLMMTAGDWWFHWDNMPVHTTAVVTNWMTARWFQIMEHPPYLPDLALAEIFLFPSVKRELAGKTLTKETLKKEWEGAVRTLSAADFTTAFSWWYDCCKKCVNIPGRSVQKSSNTKCTNYNYFLSIGVIRVRSKYTLY
jgi:hypothetical protein